MINMSPNLDGRTIKSLRYLGQVGVQFGPDARVIEERLSIFR